MFVFISFTLSIGVHSEALCRRSTTSLHPVKDRNSFKKCIHMYCVYIIRLKKERHDLLPRPSYCETGKTLPPCDHIQEDTQFEHDVKTQPLLSQRQHYTIQNSPKKKKTKQNCYLVKHMFTCFYMFCNQFVKFS